MEDPRGVNTDEIVKRLSAEFTPQHELTQRQIAALLEQLTRHMDVLERRMDSLERAAGYNYLLDQARRAAAAKAAGATGSIPGPGTSRPVAIDHACGTDPTDEPVMVCIPEFGESGLEIEPEPGSDPEKVWPGALHAINTAGSSDGRKHRR